MEQKPVINDKNRQPNGKFAKGNNANPNGRPKGSGISITTTIKNELEKVPEGEKSSYLAILVKQILKKAILENDTHTQRLIWNYVDGMPKQGMDLTSGDKPIPLLTNLNVQDNNGDKESVADDQEN